MRILARAEHVGVAQHGVVEAVEQLPQIEVVLERVLAGAIGRLGVDRVPLGGRQLAALADEPEVLGLLALMLLHHARRASRTRADGSIVPLADQDRRQWDTDLIAEGILIAQGALARDQLGEYQAQAAIAALHADAARVEETDWAQIVEWYDELLQFADTPIVRLNRAVAVGEADGAPAGLAALAAVETDVPRREAVAAYLHEKNGDLELAADLYADAARNAPNLAERDHQIRQAVRLNQRRREALRGCAVPPV